MTLTKQAPLTVGEHIRWPGSRGTYRVVKVTPSCATVDPVGVVVVDEGDPVPRRLQISPFAEVERVGA